MYTSSNELIKNELPNRVIKPIYNIFEDSFMVYNELLKEKKQLFKGEYLSEIKGRLVNYIIKRYFDEDILPKTFPFEVRAVKMAYGQKRTELRRNNIILTLAKASAPNALPSYSKYKAIFAKQNSYINKQMMINIDDEEKKYMESPYYGIITYEITNNSLQFLNIIIPDSNYKSVLDSIPLTASLKVITEDDSDDEDERLLGRENIKKEVIDDIESKDKERGSLN